MIGPLLPPVEQWWRRAEVLSVHDGDTVTVRIDAGFAIYTVHPLRVWGVNAPELKTADGSGNIARDFTNRWTVEHMPHKLMIRFMSWDAYNPRFDGILICSLGHCLNDDLLSAGMAVPMKRA